MTNGLFEVIERELDRDEDRDSRDIEINSLIKISQEDIDLNTYIPIQKRSLTFKIISPTMVSWVGSMN